jgi:hypothetical protein
MNKSTIIDLENDSMIWEDPFPFPKAKQDLSVQNIISPKHYKDVIPGYEYMDVMEHVLGFEGTIEHLRGQIFKYLMRFGKKDDRRVEAGKIAWYSKRLEEVLQRNLDGRFPIKPRS